jgi:hypothetical protein
MAMIVVVAVGLMSRQGIFPTPLGEYPGDAFWAMMVYCGLGCLWPQLKPLPRAASALWLSYVPHRLSRSLSGYNAWPPDVRSWLSVG